MAITEQGLQVIKQVARDSLRYVGFVQDRHADPEIRVFTSRQSAIDWVNKRFAEVVAHPEYIVNDDYLPEYELHLSYEPESDYAFVQAVDVATD